MLLDHTNPDSIAKNTTRTMSVLRGLRDNIRRGASRYNRTAPDGSMSLATTIPTGETDLDVRLCSNADGELWFATGDVQFDTTHGAACEACTISANSDDDELSCMARELVEGVADQLAQTEDE